MRPVHNSSEQMMNNDIIELVRDFTIQKISSLLDITDLKAGTTNDGIIEISELAKTYKCASVCVNPVEVDILPLLLISSSVKECYVIDFPLGKSDINMKVALTEYTVKKSRGLRKEGKGKIEFDMVINLGRFKKDPGYTLKEINSVCEAADGELVKVIIKSPELNENEIIKISEIVSVSKAGFIKNSTGMDSYGAIPEHIRIMRKVAGDKMGVKAAGGIRDALSVMQMIQAGAYQKSLQNPLLFRIGTSAPLQIFSSFQKLQESIIR